MKTPFSERTIADYFVGAIPQDEIDSMVSRSKIRAQELKEEGDDVSWEVLFFAKVVALMDAYDKEIGRLILDYSTRS